MAQTTEGIHSVLSRPSVYRLSQVVLGGPKRHRVFVRDYVRPRPGMRVLDLGCGPGEMLRLMPGAEYHGFDINEQYIEMARRRFGDAGTFVCSDVAEADLGGRSFDVVTAHGLLHHLDDDQVDRLMAAAADALAEGGSLLTADPVRLGDTAPFARWLIRHDRGRSVRAPEGYAELGRRHFADVEVSVERERILPPLLPTRYPMAVMRCRTPIAGGSA